MAKIGINAVLLTDQSGGLGEYILNLISGLHELDRDEFIVFISKKYQDYLISKIPDIQTIALDLPVENPVLRTALEPLVWPSAIAKSKIKLLHATNSYIPLGIQLPAVLTIHDLRYWHAPETYTKLRGKYLEYMIGKSIKKAEKIIAISDFTKQDILKYFPIHPEKVCVVHQGLNMRKFSNPMTEIQQLEILERYKIEKPFILAVGHLEPRKNYERLFEAFKKLLDKGRVQHKLVIVGRENWYYEQIYSKVDALELKDNIVFTGFVQDEYLPYFYLHADLFIAPSTFEGFGFTPLEAMVADTPVLASKIASHPEVLGDAALYFDPFDIDDIADKIEFALEQQTLTDDLRRKAQKNLERFQWDKCCKETYNVYQDILG